MTVEALKDALTALPKEERHTIALWLNELDYDHWIDKWCGISRQAGAVWRGESEWNVKLPGARQFPSLKVGL